MTRPEGSEAFKLPLLATAQMRIHADRLMSVRTAPGTESGAIQKIDRLPESRL